MGYNPTAGKLTAHFWRLYLQDLVIVTNREHKLKHDPQNIDGWADEAASDVNKLLDGSTYPGWKMACNTNQHIFLAGVKRNMLLLVTSNAT